VCDKRGGLAGEDTDMRLVVLGRTGQVARELARAAEGGGHALRAMGRAEADLSDPAAAARALAALLDAERPHAVINAAAYTAVDRAEEEEALATAVNGAAPAALAREAAARGVPFLHVSTDYVFDGAGGPYAPDAPTAPLGAYGRSKLAGEAGVRAAGGTHTILRTAWVFSAHGRNFARTMLRLGAERDVLRVVADQRGGPTPAAAIAAALLVMARALAEGAPSGTHHLAGAPDTTWAGFAREIMARAGLGARVEGIATRDYPTPAARPAYSRLDCASLKRVFGIARPDWREGLGAVLADLAAEARA
jgi:dTDP-4-dehydrorhamnose reductase